MRKSKMIYVNGCSWSAGDGAQENPTFDASSLKKIPYTVAVLPFAWPTYLGELTGMNVINDALGGGSNARIVRMTMDYVLKLSVEQRKETLVIIAWTMMDRDEIYIEQNKPFQSGWVKFNAAHPFYSLYPKGGPMVSSYKVSALEKLREAYVSEVHCLRGAAEKFLQQVCLLKNFLENMGVKYFFFSALPNLSFISPSTGLDHLIKSVENQPYIFDLNYTASILCDEINAPMTSCIHPLIPAHQSIAKWVYDNLKTAKLID